MLKNVIFGARRCLVRPRYLRKSLRIPSPVCIHLVLNTSPKQECILSRSYSAISANDPSAVIDAARFEEVCEETLHSLTDYFDELVENSPHLKGTDVTYGDGVLTVNLGQSHGTYVINRQSPNKQIWLSSPCSGPKRYDFDLRNGGRWIYKHDGQSLHRLLQNEISKILAVKVDFSKCSYGQY